MSGVNNASHQSPNFDKYRLLCLTLLKQPNEEILNNLTCLVQQSPASEFNQIQDHLMFPHQVYLKKPTSNLSYTISVIHFIETFYNKVKLDKYFILKDVLTSLLALTTKVQSVKDEFQLGFLQCIEAMLLSCCDDVFQQFCNIDNKLVIGHLVFTTLEWAEKEQSPAVKSSCISLLRVLASRQSEDFCKVYVGLLPGISSRLVKICQDSTLTQASVKASAVKTWSLYVSKIFNDNNRTEMDEKFIENASLQLATQFTALQGLASHSDTRARDSLLSCANALMKQCWLTLENCRYQILNILVINDVSGQPSEQALQYFVNKHGEDNVGLCLEINKIIHQINKDIEKDLTVLSTEKLEEKLCLLLGYIKFLANIEASSSFFVSKMHLDLLLQNLVSLSQFEHYSKSFGISEIETSNGLEKVPLLNVIFSKSNISSTSKPGKSFRYLKTKSSEKLFYSICQCLGKFESFGLVVDFLLERMNELDYFKKEAMLVLNNVILGACGKDVLDECLPVIQYYFETNNSSLAIIGQEERMIPSDQWSAILLAVEGLGYIVKVNGLRVKYHIPEILYFSISQLPSECSFSWSVLYFSLCDIAEGCGCHHIVDVIEDHLDHMSRQFNLNLRQRNLSAPGMQTLLSLVIKICLSKNNSSVHQDVLDSINSLTLNLSMSEGGQVLHVLNLICVIVSAYKDTFEKSIKVDAEEDDTGFLTRIIQNLEDERQRELEEMNNIEESLQNEKDGEIEDTSELADDPDENVEIEARFDKIFLKTCLDHVQHFVSMSGKPKWQLKSLEIITICLELLAHTPEESPGQNQETYLPLVHKIWSSLHLLFKSNNIFIVDKAFDCLKVICEHSRDFVHKRVVSDVLPSIVKFFKTLDLLNKDTERQKTLAARQSERILNKLICGLWDILYLLNLSPLESDALIEMIVFNLRDHLSVDQIRDNLTPRRSVDANILELKLVKVN